MTAYYFVFFLALFASVFLRAKNEIQQRWKLFFIFLPLFVYAAIRIDYGNDYSSYEELYNMIHTYENFQVDKELHAEIGFQFLLKLLPSFRALLVLNAFLLSFSLAYFCYQNVQEKYYWIAIVLIFLNPEKNIFGTLVAIRSGICVSCFLFSFVLIQKRKWLLYFTITIVLSFLHTSSLLFLPIAYFVGTNIPFTQKEIFIWIMVVLILLATPVTKFFDMLDILISNDIFERYDEVVGVISPRRGWILTVTSIAFIAMFLIYFYTCGSSLSANENSLIRMGILFSIFSLLGSLSTRSSYFYDMFFIASVVKVVSDKNASYAIKTGLLSLALVSSYYSMFHVWMNSPWWDHAIYHSLIGDV